MKASKVIAILAIIVIVIPLAPRAPAADSSFSVTAKEAAMYRQIAHRTFENITRLKERYPHLRSITADVRVDEAKEKLWIAYHYAHDWSSVPNPDYVAGKKSSETVKWFSPVDGIELNLYFYEGSWPGQASVSPLSIGDMHVVTMIEGNETPELASLRHAIGRIIRDEQAAHRKKRHRY